MLLCSCLVSEPIIPLQGCHRSGNGQAKILQGREKYRELYFESWKVDILKKSEGNEGITSMITIVISGLWSKLMGNTVL